MGTSPAVSYGRRMPTLHIDHAISDLSTWRDAFDALQDVRRHAGVLQDLVRQPVDDPLRVIVDLDFDTIEHAEAFREFLVTTIWAMPTRSPALVGSPSAVILDTLLAEDLRS